MPAAFHKVAIWLTARDRILARDETARRSVLDFPCNRSRTDDVKSVRGPPMQQIGEWLAKLGLAEYASCFAENRIDFTVLPDLTDQDLKDLGRCPR